jgi:hypothetical protein
MASTYVLISSQVLGSTAASVTFSSIPSTYTDLVIQMSCRDAYSGSNDNLWYRLNGDTGTNYSGTWVEGSGSAASSSRIASFSLGPMLYLDGNGNTANTFSSHELYIPNYNSTTAKPIFAISATEDNSATAYIRNYAGLYRGTSAITSILLTPNGQNFLAGSSFYLYGVKNS